MKTKRLINLGPALPALVALAAAAAPASAQGINVYVNGEAVAFPGQPPVQSAGTVLVPLRGVFEKLGASVQYEPATKTIFATKGATSVTLRLGDAQALVNGTARALSVPAQAVGGTTLVPLRFVSEALGAGVKWEAPTRSVVIDTGATRANDLPTPAASGPVTGTITGIFPETRSVTMRVTGGENTRVVLAPDALVLVQGTSGPATQASLSDLRVGDQITIRRNADNLVSVITAAYGERRGEVKSVNRLASGVYIVTLSDGSIVEVAQDAPVTMAGRAVRITDIQPGEQVVIRTNPQTQQGIGLAVVTGDTTTPATPTKVNVTALSHNATRALRVREALTVTLRGTPGATGNFSIPGVPAAQSVPLKETSPGVYTGTFTIPAGINIRGAAVLASLTVGGTTSPIIQAGTTVTIDSIGPNLTNLTPANNATINEDRPLIYGTFSDAGTGINRTTIQLTVDGRVVTPQATVTEAFISYQPPANLAPGAHQVVLLVADNAGNPTRSTWNFNVTQAQSLVRSVSTNAANATLNAGQALTVRMEAETGGTATFDVGGTIKGVPMNETSPGVYTGTYTIKRGESVTKAPVTVNFRSKAGRAFTQAASQAVTVAAGAPPAPVIDAPQEGAAVGGRTTISGTATPGTTVRISVAYQGRLLILPVQGTAAEREVQVGANGRWAVPDLDLPQPTGVSGLSYTLTAVAVDAAGQTSDTATVTFKR